MIIISQYVVLIQDGLVTYTGFTVCYIVNCCCCCCYYCCCYYCISIVNPSIVQTSVNMMCVMGISCQLFCLVEGVPSPDVTFWKDSNLVVAENNAIELFETVNNYTNKGLMLNVVETVLSTVGVYICRGANSLVSDETIESNPINLIVHCKYNTYIVI